MSEFLEEINEEYCYEEEEEEEEKKYYTEEDEKNIEELKQQADSGNLEAIFKYACIMDDNNNFSEAKKYYKKLIEKGNIEAINRYAEIIYNDDIEESLEYYKIAANKGNKKAMNMCAKILYEGRRVIVNKNEAAKYYKMAADNGSVEAMYKYAKMLYNGDGIPKNKEDAAEYYKKAVDKKHLVSTYKYAKMLDYGDGISENKKEALKYYEKLKNLNNKTALYNYATILYNGFFNVPANKTEAAKYYKKAADLGDKYAAYEYAKMLDYGDGIQKNKEEAIKYYEKAEKQYKIYVNERNLVGEGGEGKVFSKLDSSDNRIIIKIPKKQELNQLTKAKRENKEKINNTIDIIGNGFTKIINKNPIEFNEEKYSGEIYKKREIDFNKKLENTIFNKNNNENFPLMSVMAQLILALEAVHLKGLILADIKPENILINKKGRLKFSDFGLSDFAKNFKENLKSCGTKSYMANELFSVDIQDGYYMNEKCDVYSLGIIFLQILTQKDFKNILNNIYINNKNDYDKKDENFIYNLKKNLSEKITIDYIDLKGFFPNINFSDKEEEIKEKFLGILKIMLKDEPSERATIFEVKEKFIELTNYMSKNLIKDNNINISIKEDLKIENKELHKLGISKEVDIKEIKTKFAKKLDFLIGNKKPNKREIKRNTFLLKRKELLPEAKECLKMIRNSINENNDDLEFLNYEEFKDKLEILKNSENMEEYIFVSDKLLELEKIRDLNAENNLENFSKKSLISVINANPEMIEHLFVLNLNEEENSELKVNIDNKNKEELKEKWLKTLFNHSCKNKDIFAIRLMLTNQNFKEMIGEELIRKNLNSSEDLNIIFNRLTETKELVNTMILNKEIDLIPITKNTFIKNKI